MLRITADVFSGRPNPVWIVTDEQVARGAMSDVVKDRGIITTQPPADTKLGFRGLLIEPLTDDMARDFNMPARFYVSLQTPTSGGRPQEMAERLIALIPQAGMALPTPGSGQPPLDLFLRAQLTATQRVSMPDSVPPPGSVAGNAVLTDDMSTGNAQCTIELAPYNPDFWNNDPNTLAHNNCYNYASNRKTDTFAQPGLGAGSIYAEITCTEVIRAALADGLHNRGDCFPETEIPRYLVALVIAPGPGFNDFHWYRQNKEGFWSHKPGSTPVRNVDNSNKQISDPANCDRGPYTQFCGYFYTCKSQKIA